MEHKYIHRLLQSFLATRTLVPHHVESYEFFIRYQLRSMILELNPIKVVSKHKQILHILQLSHVVILPPTRRTSTGYLQPLYPHEARSLRMTYQADVYVNCRHSEFRLEDGGTYVHTHSHIYQHIYFFSVPCMLKSSVCHLHVDVDRTDRRGTFLINGYDKCIIPQETLKINFPYVSKNQYRVGAKYLFRCQIRSAHPQKIRSTSTSNIYVRNVSNSVPMMFVSVPYINTSIRITTVYILLGITSAEAMCRAISHVECDHGFTRIVNHMVRRMMAMDSSPSTIQEAYDDLATRCCLDVQFSRRKKYINHLFNTEFLPHCGIGTNPEKISYFSIAIRKLLHVFRGSMKPDHVDSYKNKRIHTTGTLLALLTRQLLRSHMKQVNVQIFKMINITASQPLKNHIYIPDVLQGSKITSGLRYAMSTGNWGIQKAMGNQTGICQMINDMNVLSTLSHCRQINTPLNRDGKMPDRRQLELSHLGLLCCAETPEGKSVGFLSNLATLAQIRTPQRRRHMQQLLVRSLGLLSFSSIDPLVHHVGTLFLVIINGKPSGYVLNAIDFVTKFKHYRQWWHLPPMANITYSTVTGHVTIDTDGGDCVRPVLQRSRLQKLEALFRIYGNKPHLLWQRLVIEGVVVYVNKMEEADMTIAMDHQTYCRDQKNKWYDHVEIHPSLTLFGPSVGCIPFSNQNQAPRNIYQSSMCKQAITGIPMNFGYTLKNKLYALNYPQKPLVQTITSHLVGESDRPSGQSVVTAVQILTGNNQEDSIIVSKAAIDRGLFSTTVYETFRSAEKNHGHDQERIEPVPDTCVHRKVGNYKTLGPDGIAEVGTRINQRDVLIGKTSTFSYTEKKNGQFRQIQKQKDKSIQFKRNEPSLVQKVCVHETSNNLKLVAVRTSTLRTPEVGDKLSSRHGQKGVIGMVIPAEDMPFTQDGLKVDIIMNCHSFPSRMTIGHLSETLFGKAAALEGVVADGTPFEGKTLPQVQKILHNNGFHNFGKEVMYSGKTGHRLKHPVYVGITFYQRLKHMVQDKIHARAMGPRQNLTRQPVEGRSRNGGLRVGEMERDSLISHGCSSILLDRLCKQSDAYKTVICKKCGFLAEPKTSNPKTIRNVLHHAPYCRVCKSHEHVTDVEIPYATKLLWQELLACHIHLKFNFYNETQPESVLHSH